MKTVAPAAPAQAAAPCPAALLDDSVPPQEEPRHPDITLDNSTGRHPYATLTQRNH